MISAFAVSLSFRAKFCGGIGVECRWPTQKLKKKTRPIQPKCLWIPLLYSVQWVGMSPYVFNFNAVIIIIMEITDHTIKKTNPQGPKSAYPGAQVSISPGAKSASLWAKSASPGDKSASRQAKSASPEGPSQHPKGPSQHPQGPKSASPEGPSQHPEGPSQHHQRDQVSIPRIQVRGPSQHPQGPSQHYVCMFMCRYVYVGDHMQDLTCELGL